MRKHLLLTSIVVLILTMTAGYVLGNDNTLVGINEISSEHKKSKFKSGILQTTNRDKYLVCVENFSHDNSNNLTSDKMIKKVQQSIDKFKQNHKFKGIYEGITLEVIANCSFSPHLIDENAVHPIYSGIYEPRRIEQAPQEALGIFIVDEDIVDKHFRDAPTRWSPEALLCEEGECNEVTKGIYVTSKEFKELSGQKLKDELAYGLSLESTLQPMSKEKEDKLKEKKEKLKESKESDK
ncbi:hypothetical protein [Chengkuizengella marina]|uniref:Uncharacterized protein n=1 Tax=Chengkuizengella marina TaxID=2507566 RepID=A0A6N9Q1Y5_9BACL|nr:hypothetical protein [Chengkuizengella marina]NBI29043.1 hypothetical protein [Chengkuizengella marina]